jgi:hypothetical protein
MCGRVRDRVGNVERISEHELEVLPVENGFRDRVIRPTVPLESPGGRLFFGAGTITYIISSTAC